MDHYNILYSNPAFTNYSLQKKKVMLTKDKRVQRRIEVSEGELIHIETITRAIKYLIERKEGKKLS